MGVPHGATPGIDPDCLDDGRNVGRFADAQRGGIRIVGVRRTEQTHTMVDAFRRRSGGRERHVTRLPRTLDRHEHTEQRVDPGDDWRHRAEVLHQSHMRSTAEHVACALVQGDVGTAKPIDRLLRIANDEDTARRDGEVDPRTRSHVGVVHCARGDEHGELDLNGVRVLELVEE